MTSIDYFFNVVVAIVFVWSVAGWFVGRWWVNHPNYTRYPEWVHKAVLLLCGPIGWIALSMGEV